MAPDSKPEAIRGDLKSEVARSGADAPGISEAEFRKVVHAILSAEEADRSLQKEHAEAFHPTLLGIAKFAFRVRWVLFLISAATPMFLLYMLLPRIYKHWDMLLAGEMNYAAAGGDLTAPIVALIIGTFASFIVVYSALLMGVFSQLKNAAGESRDKLSPISSNAVTEVVKKVMAENQ